MWCANGLTTKDTDDRLKWGIKCRKEAPGLQKDATGTTLNDDDDENNIQTNISRYEAIRYPDLSFQKPFKH